MKQVLLVIFCLLIIASAALGQNNGLSVGFSSIEPPYFIDCPDTVRACDQDSVFVQVRATHSDPETAETIRYFLLQGFGQVNEVTGVWSTGKGYIDTNFRDYDVVIAASILDGQISTEGEENCRFRVERVGMPPSPRVLIEGKEGDYATRAAAPGITSVSVSFAELYLCKQPLLIESIAPEPSGTIRLDENMNLIFEAVASDIEKKFLVTLFSPGWTTSRDARPKVAFDTRSNPPAPVFTFCPDEINLNLCTGAYQGLHAFDPEYGDSVGMSFNLVSGPGSVSKFIYTWRYRFTPSIDQHGQSHEVVIEAVYLDQFTSGEGNCRFAVNVGDYSPPDFSVNPDNRCGQQIEIEVNRQYPFMFMSQSLAPPYCSMRRNFIESITPEPSKPIGFAVMAWDLEIGGDHRFWTYVRIPEEDTAKVFKFKVGSTDLRDTAYCELELIPVPYRPLEIKTAVVQANPLTDTISVDVTLTSAPDLFNHFDFSFGYDTTILELLDVSPNESAGSVDCLGLTIRYYELPSAQCDECPSGLVRVVGSINKHWPDTATVNCLRPDNLPLNLFSFDFRQKPSANQAPHFSPIPFVWTGYFSNSSNTIYEDLLVGAKVFDALKPDSNIAVIDPQRSFPTLRGLPIGIISAPEDISMEHRIIDFYNGGIWFNKSDTSDNQKHKQPYFINCPDTVGVCGGDSVFVQLNAIHPRSENAQSIRYHLVDGYGSVNEMTGVWSYAYNRDECPTCLHEAFTVEIAASIGKSHRRTEDEENCKFVVKVSKPTRMPTILVEGQQGSYATPAAAPGFTSVGISAVDQSYCLIDLEVESITPEPAGTIELKENAQLIFRASEADAEKRFIVYLQAVNRPYTKVAVVFDTRSVISTPQFVECPEYLEVYYNKPQVSFRLNAIDTEYGDGIGIRYSVLSGPGRISFIRDVPFYRFNLFPTDGEQTYRVELQAEYAGQVTSGSENCEFDIKVANFNPQTIRLGQAHDAIQGKAETISITMDSSPLEIGGFDFLIQYNPAALVLQDVTPGQFYEDCGWEYFKYRVAGDANCWTAACPAGIVSIMSVANINDGVNEPSCHNVGPNSSSELAVLSFMIPNDRTLECTLQPIRFIWYDCRDNVLEPKGWTNRSKVNYVSNSVYDIDLLEQTHEITNHGDSNGYPTFGGHQYSNCADTTGVSLVNFYNGYVHIVCADSIDARCDFNLNELNYEVADYVMFANYFIYGDAAFDDSRELPLPCMDTNADGIIAALNDLVYFGMIVRGDAGPYPTDWSTIPHGSAIVRIDLDLQELSIQTTDTLGAAFFIFSSRVEPTLLKTDMNLGYYYTADSNHTRILVSSLEGNSFTEGPLLGNIQTNALEYVEISTVDGRVVDVIIDGLTAVSESEDNLPKKFALRQNYPNPFNPTTMISFDLPRASEVEFEILNVIGQTVYRITGYYSAGSHTIEWNADQSGQQVASGIYYYRIKAGDFSGSRKMVLLK